MINALLKQVFLPLIQDQLCIYLGSQNQPCANLLKPIAFNTTDYDFTGTRHFDAHSGYLSRSFIAEERKVMNDHMVATLEMLEQLPFPKHLQRVTEYAACHHERMDGKGYPRGFTREQMSIPARMMGRMAEEGPLDSDLFHIFVQQRVYQRYAAIYLNPEQVDTPDLTTLSGYTPTVKDLA